MSEGQESKSSEGAAAVDRVVMPLPSELFMFFAHKGIMPEGGSTAEQVESIKWHWKEMERKHSNQAGFIREFHRCLDGIKEIQCIPGSAIEGCRDAQAIRSIVETLVANCPLTFEDNSCGRAKA